MNKIDYILVMVLMVLLSGCNSLFDKEIPEYQVSDATAVTDQASAETALLGVYSYLGDYCLFLLNTGNCWKNGNCVGK